MKKIILIALLCYSFGTQAQFGGLLNKGKGKGKKDEKETKVVKPVKDTPESRIEIDSITSAIHIKYLNKIVFASDMNSISFSKEIESNFKTDFNLGDLIYLRVYMDNSLFNYVRPLINDKPDDEIRKYSTFLFKIYIDNVLVDNLSEDAISRQQFDYSEKDHLTTFKGALKSTEKDSYLAGIDMFNDVLLKHESKLTKGKHQVKFEILPNYINTSDGINVKGKAIAGGEITLNVNGSVINPNDTKMCMPGHGMLDEELITKIKRDFFKMNQVKADEVRVLSTSWKMERNKYNSAVERRTVEAYIGYKDSKTNLCYKRNYLVTQEFDGTKFVDELSLFTNTQNPAHEISCKCLATQKESEVKKEPVKKTTSQPKKGK